MIVSRLFGRVVVQISARDLDRRDESPEMDESLLELNSNRTNAQKIDIVIMADSPRRPHAR